MQWEDVRGAGRLGFSTTSAQLMQQQNVAARISHRSQDDPFTHCGDKGLRSVSLPVSKLQCSLLVFKPMFLTVRVRIASVLLRVEG